MSWLEIFSMIKEITVTVAACVTAYVAWKGIERWQTELTGKANFDVARELAKSVYQVRDAMSQCRSPFTAAHEFPDGYDGHLSKRTSEEEGQAWAFVYKNRWEPVRKALQSLDTSTLEAEALWGKEIREKVHALRQCSMSLFANIDAFLANKYAGGEHFKDTEFAKEVKNGVWEKNSGKDELSIQINNTISEIESVIRPHLSKR